MNNEQGKNTLIREHVSLQNWEMGTEKSNSRKLARRWKVGGWSMRSLGFFGLGLKRYRGALQGVFLLEFQFV